MKRRQGCDCTLSSLAWFQCYSQLLTARCWKIKIKLNKTRGAFLAMFSAPIASLYFPQLLCNKKKKTMPTVIKRNLFMVFSSHQSLLPVTSMVKSAVMLWDQFWFGVFCVWVFTATAASPRQSLEGKSVWTNQGDCRRDGYVYKSVCACAQLCTCSPAEELWRHYITTFHACSLCVCVGPVLRAAGRLWG